jgi:hypothetical protein
MYPKYNTPVDREAAIEHAFGRRTETMCWADPGEKPAVKTTILEDDNAAKRALKVWAKENEGKPASDT